MTQYVVFGEDFNFHESVEGARLGWVGTNPCRVYELGPEVKEPDYSKLIDWILGTTLDHLLVCALVQAEGDECTCGLSEALLLAGVSE